jgi:hypothetical protein
MGVPLLKVISVSANCIQKSYVPLKPIHWHGNMRLRMLD